MPGHSASRDEKTVIFSVIFQGSFLTLTASSGYAQLIECKKIALDTEKRPLADRVMEKLKLAAKMFLLSAILFAVLSAALK